MKYLFYLGHPAHYHLFRETIRELKSKKHIIEIVIKKKDVLEDLLKNEGWDYRNIYPYERKNTRLSIAFSLFCRDMKLFNIVRKFKPFLMIGTSSEITHIGTILRIPSIVVNEDDAEAVPFFAKLSYPFASNILAPSTCSVGKWEKKTIFYEGYHELAYLYPKRISKQQETEKKKKFFLRFAKLTAHHDEGKKGISNSLALMMINKLKDYGDVYISSERILSPELEKYRIALPPSEVLKFLSSCDIYIGDSQTMTAEAAVLGIPSIRFNDFVGKLGYLEELESKYNLTFGIKTSEPEKLLSKINELLKMQDITSEWQKRRMKMLADKIDVTAFIVWFIENFPRSATIMKKDANYSNRFK